jgi:hypothetical protein
MVTALSFDLENADRGETAENGMRAGSVPACEVQSVNLDRAAVANCIA